ncbi:D-alanyl-D-alanine carboxypeptidase [Kitasatospora cystarginea]|uniref:D-alanyl-D-alanine carboxypeptidase family protein n=1 Tax=Kitasatospora cystarginea TaxID=58350 RepID=UPI0031D6F365
MTGKALGWAEQELSGETAGGTEPPTAARRKPLPQTGKAVTTPDTGPAEDDSTADDAHRLPVDEGAAADSDTPPAGSAAPEAAPAASKTRTQTASKGPNGAAGSPMRRAETTGPTSETEPAAPARTEQAADLAEDSADVEDSADAEEPADAEDAVTAENSVAAKDSADAEDAVAAEDSADAEDAVAAEDSADAEDAVAAEDSADAEEAVAAEDSADAEDAATAEDPADAKDSGASEDTDGAAEVASPDAAASVERTAPATPEASPTGAPDEPAEATVRIAKPAGLPTRPADTPKPADTPAKSTPAKSASAGDTPAKETLAGARDRTESAQASAGSGSDTTMKLSVPRRPGAAREAGTGRPTEPERTREQPVPPVPAEEPLKVLAELTNTPPPPQTFWRTVLRRVKIWTPLVVLLAIVFCAVQMLRPLPKTVLVMSGAPSYTFAGGPLAPAWPSEGEAAVEVEGVGSLGTYGEQKPVPTASMAKVMTAYVVLRDHPLKGDAPGPDITVDAQATKESNNQDESRAGVGEGQHFTEHQMLELMLIPSSNNIARLLGRWDAGSDEAFVKKMNAAARQLGMNDTTYTDPSGLDAGTRSTAVDQLKLAGAAMQDPVFRAVVATPNTTIDGVPDRLFNNNNDLVNPGVIGIKTGSSTAAGGNLMWAAQQTADGRKQLILGVVMGQQSGFSPDASLNKALTVSQKLITQVQKALTSATVLKKGEAVGYVDDGLGGRAPVVAAADLTMVGWPGMKTQLTLSADAKGVPRSAKAGTVVGVLILRSGAVAGPQVPVALQHDLSVPGLGAKLSRLG